MTEQEIRKQVKKDFRRTRRKFLKYKLQDIGVGVGVGITMGIIMAPFLIHIFAITGEPVLNLSHGWIIATGILGIPAAILLFGSILLLFVIGPIITVVSKIQEHRQEVENAVQYYVSHQKEGEK